MALKAVVQKVFSTPFKARLHLLFPVNLLFVLWEPKLFDGLICERIDDGFLKPVARDGPFEIEFPKLLLIEKGAVFEECIPPDIELEDKEGSRLIELDFAVCKLRVSSWTAFTK